MKPDINLISEWQSHKKVLQMLDYIFYITKQNTMHNVKLLLMYTTRQIKN
jgi:hypothetical protein